MSCKNIVNPEKCTDHRNKDCLNDILREFYRRHSYLTNNYWAPDSVIKYNILIDKKKCATRIIYLGQDYIHGKSIKKLRDKRKLPKVVDVANAIIDVLNFLQMGDQVVTHGYLNEKSMFVGNDNRIRIADYDLIPYLMYLKGTHHIHKINDLEALGSIVKGFRTRSKSSKDFIKRCQSGKVFSIIDLKTHPFLGNPWKDQTELNQANEDILLDDFEIEEKLGAGSYGIVLKATNEIENKSYAFKLINISTKKKKHVEQMEREAKIMSDRCEHPHTVKYIASWKQKLDLSTLKKFIDDEELKDFVTSSSPSDLSGPNQSFKYEF